MTRSCACAILAVAFVVPTSFAQTQEDIQDLAALTLEFKLGVAKLETEEAWRGSYLWKEDNQARLAAAIEAAINAPPTHDFVHVHG